LGDALAGEYGFHLALGTLFFIPIGFAMAD
jgi:hypothetical protein